MKLLIAGSRSITNFDISPYIPPDTDLIISGGAGGVNTLAESYADKHRIEKLYHLLISLKRCGSAVNVILRSQNQL